MTDRTYTVLIADADSSVRRDLSSELSAMGLTVFEAADGQSALRTVQENDIRVVLCELYLRTELESDLITAIRSNKSLNRTRTVVHTRFLTSNDRDWARHVGADAYLIRPVKSKRLRDVVSRVATGTARNAPVLSNGSNGTSRPAARRLDSLEVALSEMENGKDAQTRSIVVGRDWWNQLTAAQQSPYRKRAKKVGARLLSNPRLTDRVVEVRARRKSAEA
jgi:two-component system chemotaxis response regulator CheY